MNWQIDKAAQLVEYVVMIRDKLLTEEHPNRLVSQHLLTTVYLADGQVGKAVELVSTSS